MAMLNNQMVIPIDGWTTTVGHSAGRQKFRALELSSRGAGKGCIPFSD